MLDGGHGITIMLALQNYLLDTPVYDGNAYAFSSTFLCGYLNLYAHYATPPAGPGQGPGYHIYQINAYALTGNHEAWLEGIAAFRNMRRLAKKIPRPIHRGSEHQITQENHGGCQHRRG